MNFQQLSALRPDLAFIAHWINPRTKVLDLGCGDGVMLDPVSYTHLTLPTIYSV